MILPKWQCVRKSCVRSVLRLLARTRTSKDRNQACFSLGLAPECSQVKQYARELKSVLLE